MAKRRPSITLSQMQDLLGYSIALAKEDNDDTPRFYSDLTVVPTDVYTRTKYELEEHCRIQGEGNAACIREGLLPELSATQSIVTDGCKVSIRYTWDMDDFIIFALVIGKIDRDNIESLRFSWASESDNASAGHGLVKHGGNPTKIPTPTIHRTRCCQLLDHFTRLRNLQLSPQSSSGSAEILYPTTSSVSDIQDVAEVRKTNERIANSLKDTLQKLNEQGTEVA
ncbi:hypothetical protein BDW74DRAFT_180494 [Aspergillus multicolor]|uniref:uncharacterized protein n=1 Tax=Aspergillus multicolor TaxID=41759 RepID=UPI003CCD715B